MLDTLSTFSNAITKYKNHGTCRSEDVNCAAICANNTLAYEIEGFNFEGCYANAFKRSSSRDSSSFTGYMGEVLSGKVQLNVGFEINADFENELISALT